MPIPILLNVPTAGQSSILDCYNGMDVAVANGYAGVRFSAGISNYGTSSGADVQWVQGAVARAVGMGLKCSILLNIAPRYDGDAIKTLNGGALAVPTLPTNTAVLDYVVAEWQAMVNAARSAAPDSALEWEWLNEPGIGGNQDPLDYHPLTDTYTHDTYTQASGTIVPEFFTSLDYVSSRVDFHACKTICFTLEGESTTVAQREVDSIVGTSAANVIARADYIGTNRYADGPATPYVAANTQAAYSAKLHAQLTRMAANPLIGSKPVKLREFGLDRTRCPRCRVPNTVRDDLVEQVKNETGIVDAAFFCFTDVKGSRKPHQPYYFFSWNRDKTPQDGVTVAP